MNPGVGIPHGKPYGLFLAFVYQNYSYGLRVFSHPDIRGFRKLAIEYRRSFPIQEDQPSVGKHDNTERPTSLILGLAYRKDHEACLKHDPFLSITVEIIVKSVLYVQ